VSSDEAHPLARFFRALHFSNTKVTNEDGGADNPLTAIRKMCRGLDRVCVFKLDIDSPVLEGKLLDAFLSSRSLTEVVDEFYVEKHIRTGAMKTRAHTVKVITVHCCSVGRLQPTLNH